jgi:hypothetical protein
MLVCWTVWSNAATRVSLIVMISTALASPPDANRRRQPTFLVQWRATVIDPTQIGEPAVLAFTGNNTHRLWSRRSSRRA